VLRKLGLTGERARVDDNRVEVEAGVAGADDPAAPGRLPRVPADHHQDRPGHLVGLDGGREVDRPAHLLGLPVPALGLDHDGQDRLAGLLIGEHHDRVREVLGRRDLAHVRGAERAGDPGRQRELREHAA
jgi:hypothetical protein